MPLGNCPGGVGDCIDASGAGDPSSIPTRPLFLFFIHKFMVPAQFTPVNTGQLNCLSQFYTNSIAFFNFYNISKNQPNRSWRPIFNPGITDFTGIYWYLPAHTSNHREGDKGDFIFGPFSDNTWNFNT